MRHLKIGYNDVLSMPTGERRYYLGMLIKEKQAQEEKMEEVKSSSGGKTRKRTISGEALKNKIKSNEINI